MRLKSWYGISVIIVLLALLSVVPLLSACGGAETPPTTETPTEIETPTTAPAPEQSEFDIVQAAVKAYLADKAGNMKASDLHMSIVEGDAPSIVSIRSADHYAAGHIPSAINIKFSELTTLPKGEILVYCYTGQSASFAAAVLGVLSYDVQNLLHGMSSWSTDPDVFVSRFNPDTHQGDFKVETPANEATKTYSFPKLDNTNLIGSSEVIKAAAMTVSPQYITATDLNMNIAEGEDMTILSVRSAEHYAVGHIPGAINIGLSSLADNLDKLDPNSPVYVYCYTGHSAAQAAALLQMIGYDAYSLKFGMCSWTTDTTVNMSKCFDATSVQDSKVEQ